VLKLNDDWEFDAQLFRSAVESIDADSPERREHRKAG
jgi:hypothetical protein